MKLVRIRFDEDLKRRLEWAVSVLKPSSNVSHEVRQLCLQLIRQAQEVTRAKSNVPKGDEVSYHQHLVLRAVNMGFQHVHEIEEFTGLHHNAAWTAAHELVADGKLMKVDERLPKRGKGRPSPLFKPVGTPTGDSYHVNRDYVGDDDGD